MALPRIPFSLLLRPLTNLERSQLVDFFGPKGKIKLIEDLDILIFSLLQKVFKGWTHVTLSETSLNREQVLIEIMKRISRKFNSFDKVEMIVRILSYPTKNLKRGNHSRKFPSQKWSKNVNNKCS